MSKTVTLNGLQFSAVEPTEIPMLKQLLEGCNGRDEMRVICHEWNNTCETVEEFATTVVPLVLAKRHSASDRVGS
jgi:hypothetical protein